MPQKILDEAKKKMDTAIEHLKGELARIRAGRANPNMLDQVMVEAYGAQMKMVEVASVTTPEPRMLLVSPFDQNNVGPIAKGIERANLGLQPAIDGNVIRITIPPMDEETRNKKAKDCRALGEEAKVVIRNIRRDGNQAIGELKKEGLSEDEIKGQEKKVQQLTDDHCKVVEEVVTEKEKQITTI